MKKRMRKAVAIAATRPGIKPKLSTIDLIIPSRVSAPEITVFTVSLFNSEFDRDCHVADSLSSFPWILLRKTSFSARALPADS